MNVLVLNAGSSSLKYQLIDMDGEKVRAKGLVERIGFKNSGLRHMMPDGRELKIDEYTKDHMTALELVIAYLTQNDTKVISSIEEINAVGHRVVHGGSVFSSSVIIDDMVIKEIEENIYLAPLHNPANLMGIKACLNIMPDIPMIAVFDTAFHQSMPETAYLYALPYEMYEEKSIRRYGFHGTSHRYIAQRTAEILSRPLDELQIINCHLGNGSSVCAIKNGESIDTSMGMTPLEGLMMGTRCGDLDPALIKHIMDAYDYTIEEVMDILNNKSGFLGLSKYSSDNRDVLMAAENGNRQCRVAADVFEYQIKKYIGAYAAAMNGVDAIVFTGGIGENNSQLRKNVVGGLSFLNVDIDDERNKERGYDDDIASDESSIRVLRISTNEELIIARDTKELVLSQQMKERFKKLRCSYDYKERCMIEAGR
jgi:acetate kinase